MREAPNALAAGFKYAPVNNKIKIYASQAVQLTGLVGADGVTPVPTTIWGYGEKKSPATWPGMTLERHVSDPPLVVKWRNRLIDPISEKPLPHLLPVDPSLHWCYSLHGYQQYSIARNGVPLVPHVHGGKNDFASDGNPEFFFSPGNEIRGPRYVEDKATYGGPTWNDAAGMLWYHDHALGLTRLNVYAGLAGFFALRDDDDTGKANNPLGLPADPYELGFAVQDRMFRNTGELFYSAFPGEPFYDDFIDDEIREHLPPGGGPTALAEFFGDHMLVNGVIWPKYSVEPRQYRVRLLNGTDSRFMRLKLRVVAAGETKPRGRSLPFYIIGSDQSLRTRPAKTRKVDFLPGERLDLIVDFKDVPFGSRVIVENILGDAPFGGDLPDLDPDAGDVFPDRRTDRVMAFDVVLDEDKSVPDTAIGKASLLGGDVKVTGRPVVRRRKLALFEGTDEIGRLQPLLGTAEPVTDVAGNTVNGAMPWHTPITENPGLGDTEIWEIYNATGDAHPVHVHLVHFQVLNREGFTADPIEQPVLQHNGTQGVGFRLENIVKDGVIKRPDASERTRRDMVMALPGEITRIKMTFSKPGRYVWHCHILSHEDHEMMRPFHVGPGPF
ncbi:multicopper oxidase domain-containing protein [Gammaproteobacteria bacterium]|nr:multicopper oxidase domain-containing protein [Gammaproteobacteria bacterium]